MKFYLLKYILLILPTVFAAILALFWGMTMMLGWPELGMAAILAKSVGVFLRVGAAVVVLGLMAFWWMDGVELGSYNSHREIPGLGHRLCVSVQAMVVGYTAATIIVRLPASLAPPSMDVPWGLLAAIIFVKFAVIHYLMTYWFFLTTKRRDKILGPLAKLLYRKKR